MSAITKKKVIKWIWIIGGILFGIPILVLISGYTPSGLIGDVLGFGLVSGVILLLINPFFAFRYYNLITFFILFVLLGLGFKLLHYPGADVLIIYGTLSLVIVFIIAIYRFIKKNNLPKYINRFGLAASLMAAFSFFALLYIVNHYPGARYMDYISVSALIIIILALVFTLPNSGFVDWSKQARTIFFRALMIPIAFLFIFTATLKLYPNVLHLSLFNNNSRTFYGKVELFNKEGLAK